MSHSAKFPETNPCGKVFNEVIFNNNNIYNKYNNYDIERKRWLDDESLLILVDEKLTDEMVINFQKQRVRFLQYGTKSISTVNDILAFADRNLTKLKNLPYPFSETVEKGESFYDGTIGGNEITLCFREKGTHTVIVLYMCHIKGIK